MMNKMKKVSAFMAAFMFLSLCLSSTAFALSPNTEQINFNANKNVLQEDLTRGNNVPTGSTGLPYPASASIWNYVYTDYYFSAPSSGKIKTTFTGTIRAVDGCTQSTVKIQLFKVGAIFPAQEYTYSQASSWSNRVLTWSNLSGNYYFKITNQAVGGRNVLNFTLNIAQG